VVVPDLVSCLSLACIRRLIKDDDDDDDDERTIPPVVLLLDWESVDIGIGDCGDDPDGDVDEDLEPCSADLGT
jgi:hypothetical protein